MERPTEKSGTILTRVQVPGAAKDFSPRVNFQCRLLLCPYSPRVQSRAATSVRTLKMANTGSHTIVWTQEEAAHSDTLTGVSSVALATVVPYPGNTEHGSRASRFKGELEPDSILHTHPCFDNDGITQTRYNIVAWSRKTITTTATATTHTHTHTHTHTSKKYI